MGTIRKLRPPWADGMKRAAKRIGTQAEAAERCGVSLRQFVKYLGGTARPPAETIKRLASAAGMTESEIFEQATEQDSLSSRIREAIEAIGTQEDAAKLAGVSSRQLRMYLGETSYPTPQVIQRLADASGFRYQYILTGQGLREDARRDALVSNQAEKADLIATQKGLQLALLEVYTPQLTAGEASATMWAIVEEAVELSIPQELWGPVFELIIFSHRQLRERTGAHAASLRLKKKP